MKNSWLYIVGVMLFGLIGLGGSPSEAAGPVGWSQKLKCETSCSRFTVLKSWDNAAVLDKETGLVWEQSPDDTSYNWPAAHFHCNSLEVSNRMGWRLPTIQELTSLVDPSRTDPALPSAHPFSNLWNSYYWTATTHGVDTTLARALTFHSHSEAGYLKTDLIRAWCVRGGSGIDTQ